MNPLRGGKEHSLKTAKIEICRLQVYQARPNREWLEDLGRKVVLRRRGVKGNQGSWGVFAGEWGACERSYFYFYRDVLKVCRPHAGAFMIKAS